jgi:hypothetical protein
VTRSPNRRGLKGKLLANSVEAYVLALETINRLSIKYRVETFAYLVCNAWELLLKSKIIQDTGDNKSIYYKVGKGEPRRTLALRDCVKKVFPDENNATRRNVEFVADLRDEATHLVISQVPPDVLALFQACVLNYHTRLNEWWGFSLSDRVPVGMMTIIYDVSPDQVDLSNPILRRQLGSDTARYLTEFKSKVRQQFEDLGKPAEFSIDINYKIALVKKPRDAEIVLATGGDGPVVGVLPVPKDPSRTHPYRQTEAIEQVNAALKGEASINRHHVQCVIRVFRVKEKTNFFYQGGVPNSPGQYSQDFVDWMVSQYRADSRFFERTRAKARHL